MTKRDLTRQETIEILACAVRDSSPEALEHFVARIWDCLGHEGHEAIKRAFRSDCEFTTFDESEDR